VFLIYQVFQLQLMMMVMMMMMMMYNAVASLGAIGGRIGERTSAVDTIQGGLTPE